MTREEAKEIGLSSIKKDLDSGKIKLNDIFVACPKPGKNSWTYEEAIRSLETDTPLEGSNMSLIDDIINFQNWKEEQK